MQCLQDQVEIAAAQRGPAVGPGRVDHHDHLEDEDNVGAGDVRAQHLFLLSAPVRLFGQILGLPGQFAQAGSGREAAGQPLGQRLAAAIDDPAADGDFRSIHRFAERDHAAITSWHVLPGVTGHYSAHTHPGHLAADIRQFFRPLRPATTGNATDQEK
jgi:hypothetical protein